MGNISSKLGEELYNLLNYFLYHYQTFRLKENFTEGNNCILFNDDIKIKNKDDENYLLQKFYMNCYKIKDIYFINIPFNFIDCNKYFDKLKDKIKNNIIIKNNDDYDFEEFIDKNNILKNINGDVLENFEDYITENNIKILFYCNDENNINSLVMDIYQFLIDEALIKL
jgi:hypothetical protein